MEWVEEPKMSFDQENPNAKVCIFAFLGPPVIACGTSGLLCGSLCLLN